MLIKRNIWLMFYLLALLGMIYLGVSAFLTWSSLHERTQAGLSYINRIFASHVNSTLDQRELLLELIGQQLLNNEYYLDRPAATVMLDRLLRQNNQLLSLGMANQDGELIAASSNIRLDKMPNLRLSDFSRENFARATSSSHMVVGSSHFMPALENWVIPFCKSIRDGDDRAVGVITAGTDPRSFLPSLEQLGDYEVLLLHDQSFEYAFASSLHTKRRIEENTASALSEAQLESHIKSLLSRHGLDLEALRSASQSAEYFAQGEDSSTYLYSLSYIPKYQLWSLAYLPEQQLIWQFAEAIPHYLLWYLLILLTLFFPTRYIHQAEKSRRHQLQVQASHDFLTGLNNRRYLQDVEQEWITPQRRSFSVLFIDLDNFKTINDSYGHSFGDSILKQVASRLQSIDFGECLICRQGGDEFIVLSRITSTEELETLASEIVAQLTVPFDVEQFRFTIGASIGICRYPRDGEAFEALFSAADSAMYHAKQMRQDYFIFTEELGVQNQYKSIIEQALHGALDKHEFHMVYQPQFSRSGRLFGVEALIRWRHPGMGLIPPDQFIPIAEDSGRIVQLGHFIMDQAIKDISRLEYLHDYYNLQLSINISVRQLMEYGFLASLKEALDRHRFPSRQVTLEITESLFIDDSRYILPLLHEIRALGIKISLDDFGTGFSSLNMLNLLPIDELKIDKSFIKNIGESPQDRGMVINILNIAQNLGLSVVAEGIEHREQSKMLVDFNCDLQQGYLHCKPIPIDELKTFFEAFSKPRLSA